MGLSSLIDMLTLALSAHPPRWVLYLPKGMAGLIGGINGVDQSSESPTAVVLIMGYQWVCHGTQQYGLSWSIH
jgi:hypothetical protein